MRNKLGLALLLLARSWVHAQAVQEPVVIRSTVIGGITSASPPIDNRSIALRANASHGFCATGSGTWSVQIQYQDGVDTGPWTNFADASSFVTNSSTTCVGLGTGYHDFISFSISGTATVSYAGTKYIWIGGIGSTLSSSVVQSFNTRTGAVTSQTGDYSAAQVTNAVSTLGSYSNPSWITALTWSKITGVPTFLVSSNNLSDVASAATSRTNLGLGTSATQASSFFLQAANNLSDLGSAATARTNLGITQANISALWIGSGCSTVTNALLVNGTCAAPGGGASIFTSYQFGLSTAITGTGNYLQTTYPNILTTTQTGAGTSGSPFIDAVGLATQTANTGLYGPASGSPAAPTFRALVGADIPAPGASSLGGTFSFSAVAHNFITSITTAGQPVAAQPAFTDLSGSEVCAQLPAFTGDTTTTAGSCATTTSKINGTAFAGASGHFAGFGASNIPVDTGIAYANVLVSGGALGTPSSGTLTNATGLPISTGVSGLGTGVATWLATPSGANLASALTTPLPASVGGSGVANTATHTLGTSNQNWATLGTGIVKNTTTTGALSNAASTDIIGLFTGGHSSSAYGLATDGSQQLFGSGGGTAPYTMCASGCNQTIPASGTVIPAITHLQGPGAVISCWDGATPKNWTTCGAASSASTPVLAAGDITFTYSIAPVSAEIWTPGGAGPAGPTGATGATGSAGTNGTNGTNGAISTIGVNGSTQTVEPELDLVAGSNVTLTPSVTSGVLHVSIAATGGGGGASTASQLLDFYAVNTSATVQTLGTGCTSSTPCVLRVKTTIVAVLTSAISGTLSGTSSSDTVFWYEMNGTFYAGYNGSETLTCSGCTAASGIVTFPDGSIPLWQTTVTASNWDTITNAMDKRSFLSIVVIVPGPGIASSSNPSTGVQTLSTDPTITPRYFTGSGAPSINCTAGQAFYTDTTANRQYGCSATNTWLAFPSVQSCGTTTSCAHTALTAPMIVTGSAALVSGTPSTAAITGISPAFTSSSSYFCVVTAESAATGALFSVANVSGSAFTITGPAAVSTVVNYVCAGN